MKYDPNTHHRRSIRLKGYDYSQNGAYFITICVQNRKCLFGEIMNGQMFLNDAGEIILQTWNALPKRFPNATFDPFVVMPNHVHGIVTIENHESVRAIPCGCPDEDFGVFNRVPTRGTPTPQRIPPPIPSTQSSSHGRKTIGDIIGAFKSITTHQYIEHVKTGKFPPFEKRLWQRNYYENIIRDEQSLHHIREYIKNNPKKWKEDKFFM